jgi:hypothetical protein
VLLAAVAAAYFAIDADAATRISSDYGIHPLLPLACVVAGAAVALVTFRMRDAWLSYAGVLASLLVTVGLVVYPRIDAVRSGRAFMERVERASTGVAELGLVGAKEQYLLELRRPSVNFGHARWREREREAADAAAWLAESPARALLVDSVAREACFGPAVAVELGRANRQQWFLVSGEPDASCVASGDRSRARLYTPPNASLNTGS